MKKLLIVSLLALMASAAFCQTPAEDDAYSFMGFTKIRKIDLLFNILPVLYTKDQINQLLPALEKAHQMVRKTKQQENEKYHEVMDEIDKSIADAVEKQILPTRKQRTDLTDLLIKFTLTRQIIAGENVETVLEVFKKVMTPAQMKIAANSLDPKNFDPAAKPDEMTQDDKVRIYIREILLDQNAYDLLVEMVKHMS